jgi:hypothetical protein
MVWVLALGLLGGCPSSAPLDAGAPHDATGDDHATGAAGAGVAGAAAGVGASAGTSGAAGASAAGTTGAAGAAGGAGAGGAGGKAGGAGSAFDGGMGGDVDASPPDVHKQTVFEFSPAANREVDLLFLIDDSLSMQALQQRLIAAFPTFIDALKGFPGGLPNLHIGVVSSSLGAGRNTTIDHCVPGGAQGIFQTAPVGTTCANVSLQLGQSFLVTDRVAGNNFTGDVSDMFSCIAALGDGGCGFEHQLASVLRALGADGAAAPAQNAGFLRPNAFLALVMLTNEDDCSAPPDSDLFDSTSTMVSDPLGPLQSYRCNEFGHLCGGHPPPRSPAMPTDLSGTCVSAEDGRLLRVGDAVTNLKKLKANPGMIVVSAIAGPTTPYIVDTQPAQVKGDPVPWPEVQHSCTAADGTYGDPAIRIKQFVDAFGANGLFEGICDADLGQSMRVAAAQLQSVISGWPCLDAAATASTCTFVDHVRDGDGGVRDVPLPACATTGGVAPCWTLPEVSNCATGRLVQFVRESGTSVVGTTATCPN